MGQRVEDDLARRGLALPPEPVVPPGVSLPFAWARVHGTRVFLSGHGALTDGGAPRGPFGSVPGTVSLAEAQDSAIGACLALLAGLRRAVGDLDRVAAWLTLSGFVQADPGYAWTTLVVNPASELLLGLYGPDVGAHARVAPGVAALPLDLPVVLAGEVEIAP